jgi:cytosine deaminase
MSDYIVTNGRTLSDETVDIEVRDGRFDRIVPAGEGDPASFSRSQRYDAEERLVTPPLIEPHTHLDLTLLAGNPYWNETNTLEEGWRIWEKQRDEVTKADVKQRARKVVKWFVANGVTRARTHLNVNTSYESFVVLDAMLELREEVSELIDLQLGAFPFDCLMTSGDGHQVDLYEESLRRGIDIAGGVPHKEHTREDGTAHVKTVADLAEKHGCPLDLHIDETDDPQSRFTEILASEALKRDIGDRTAASHVTAMHSYSNAYADKLVRLIADSGVSVVTNPMSNAVLQGRYDDFPRRRGHTRINALREAGVPVAIGQDDIVDHFNSYGDGDPLSAVFVLIHYAHMDGQDDVEALWDMLIHGNADVYGADDYGIEEGNRGSLVVYDGYTPFDVLRTRPPRTLVLKDGRAVAQTDRTSTIHLEDGTEEVSYTRQL